MYYESYIYCTFNGHKQDNTKNKLHMKFRKLYNCSKLMSSQPFSHHDSWLFF